jgi:hypothetical protein
MPGPGSDICPGHISAFTMHNENSTSFLSGGGARTAMHSWMTCGDRVSATSDPPSRKIIPKKGSRRTLIFTGRNSLTKVHVGYLSRDNLIQEK